jgi:hypothetical protein
VLIVAVLGASGVAVESPGGAGLAGLGRNGLIAYSYAGDIYVGDPATGKTTAISTNAAYETEPIFAPGGHRIAFIRGNPQTAKAKIVVVRTDGADERLILPRRRKHRGLVNYGWTPDSKSLVVELDRPPFTFPHGDGELSLFDSFGRHHERVLTPPLPRSTGAHYWGHDQVAPMFRPPSADHVLSGGWNNVRAFDSDLKTAASLGDALKPYATYYAAELTWSPDGAEIGLRIERYTSTRPGATTIEGGGLFVMRGGGDKLRRIADVHSPFWQWSPDGSKIAFERVRAKTDRAVLAILDLKSGKERTLESTSAAGKDAGAMFPTTTYNNIVHHWFYESWMWAPDGRSLLVLENLRTRPWVVDITSDTVKKLPWLADSMPSWQRLTRG